MIAQPAPDALAAAIAAVEALGRQQGNAIRLQRLQDQRRYRHHLAHLIAAGLTTFDQYVTGRSTFHDRRNARCVERYFRRFGAALQIRKAA